MSPYNFRRYHSYTNMQEITTEQEKYKCYILKLLGFLGNSTIPSNSNAKIDIRHPIFRPIIYNNGSMSKCTIYSTR